MRTPANLAARPLANHRLPTALVVVSASLLLVLTVLHVLEVRRLAGRQATTLDAEAVSLDSRIAVLDAEIEAVERLQVDKDTSAHWSELASLVERRRFAWTKVLEDFEKALPPDVRILSLSPRFEKGGLVLSVSAAARNIDAVTGPQGVVASLRESSGFADALPESVQYEGGEVKVQLSVRTTGGQR